MELKRILARDSRSANEKAIQLYGRDVMIVSSQRVDNQIELVVAIESPQTEAPAAESTENLVKGPKGPGSPAKSFGQVFKVAQSPEPQMESDPVELAGVRPIDDVTPSGAYEFKRSQEIVSLLRQEIATLREDLLLSVRTRMIAAGSPLSAAGQALMDNLGEAGMPASMQLLLGSGLEQVENTQDGLAFVAKTLHKTMKRAHCPVPGTGWHAVVGPTGAGKTSMVARLAYAAACSHGAEQQALISFDDGRAGAWAQMQVLASQAGVNCYRAQDVQSLKTLLDDLGPKRTVWVDTAGVNFPAAAKALADLGIALHAVLPVDATLTHAQKLLQNKELKLRSLMLTKVDEAIPSWAMIKGLCDSQLPVSCMATHAGIQTALLPYDPQLLIDGALASAGLVLGMASPEKPRTKTVRRSKAPPKATLAKKPRKVATKAVHG